MSKVASAEIGRPDAVLMDPLAGPTAQDSPASHPMRQNQMTVVGERGLAPGEEERKEGC